MQYLLSNHYMIRLNDLCKKYIGPKNSISGRKFPLSEIKIKKNANPSCKKNPREFKTPSLWRGITKIFHGRPLIIWASEAWVEPGTNRLTFRTTNRKVFSETSNPSAVSWESFLILLGIQEKFFYLFFSKKTRACSEESGLLFGDLSVTSVLFSLGKSTSISSIVLCVVTVDSESDFSVFFLSFFTFFFFFLK